MVQLVLDYLQKKTSLINSDKHHVQNGKQLKNNNSYKRRHKNLRMSNILVVNPVALDGEAVSVPLLQLSCLSSLKNHVLSMQHLQYASKDKSIRDFKNLKPRISKKLKNGQQFIFH